MVTSSQQYSPYTSCTWVRHDGSCLISRGKATFGRVLSKTSWRNPKITWELCGSPIRVQRSLPEETFWLTGWLSSQRNRTHRTEHAFVYLCITYPNEIMILRLFGAPLFSEPPNILTLQSGNEPGLRSDGSFLFLDMKFPKSALKWMWLSSSQS